MSNISRTCKEIRKDAQSIPSRPLADYRESAAYVLLAPPGAGKTTEFEKEAEEIPDALCVTARDFITLEDENWSQKTYNWFFSLILLFQQTCLPPTFFPL